MALTSNNLEIIKALANNDVHAAKRAALASLAEDKSKKNEYLNGVYRKRLMDSEGSLPKLPPNVEGFLVGEAPQGFDEKRYLLRERDGKVFKEIQKMKLIADELSSRNIPYKNTTLLYGVSGTGKTEFGRYVAKKLDLPFYYISFSSMIDSYMGSTAKNIHKVFDFCRNIPCILMLDEIDCISMKRTSGGSKGVDGELERTTISIMQELDRLPNHVIVIAATNRLDIVDDAMLRRFSIHHEMTPMSEDEMRALIDKFLTATDTEDLVSEKEKAALAKKYTLPGNIMPELTRLIGEKIYDEKKEELEKKAEESVRLPNVWNVRYILEALIQAETKAEAVEELKQKRLRGLHIENATEWYEAEPEKY